MGLWFALEQHLKCFCASVLSVICSYDPSQHQTKRIVLLMGIQRLLSICFYFYFYLTKMPENWHDGTLWNSTLKISSEGSDFNDNLNCNWNTLPLNKKFSDWNMIFIIFLTLDLLKFPHANEKELNNDLMYSHDEYICLIAQFLCIKCWAAER